MKVLIVSAADAGGGAFIASRRLHLALLKHGIDSHIILGKSYKDLPNSSGPTTNTAHTRSDIRNYCSLPLHWLCRSKSNDLRSFNIFPSGLHKIVNDFNADIVNLHWINREMLSIAEIGKINAPIVWTLHDMWPLLGSEHYPSAARTSDIRSHLGLETWMYQRKKRHWSKKDIVFIGPSQWMCKQVGRSKNFSSIPCLNICNPIDLNTYKPVSRRLAKQALGLCQERRYILFGSMSGTSDRRKGFQHLRDALALIEPSTIDNIELLTFGSSNSQNNLPEPWRDKVATLGHLNDDSSLCLAYNAAELFVAPSELDNLPNTIVESLACGTPVATFADTGGCHEMIEHKVSGYVANKFDSRDLAGGITWILERGTTEGLRALTRRKARQMFSESAVARKYSLLFQSIINKTMDDGQRLKI